MGPELPVQERGDPTVAVGGVRRHQRGDQWQNRRDLRLLVSLQGYAQVSGRSRGQFRNAMETNCSTPRTFTEFARKALRIYIRNDTMGPHEQPDDDSQKAKRYP